MIRLDTALDVHDQVESLLQVLKQQSEACFDSKTLNPIESAKAHLFVKLHLHLSLDKRATLTVLDCSASLKESVCQLGYVLNSIYRKLAPELKKSRAAKEFN